MTIKIDKNVPLPSAKTIKDEYPLNEMEPGDSIYFEAEDKLELYRIRNMLLSRAKRLWGNKSFSSRQEDLGVRLWRLK